MNYRVLVLVLVAWPALGQTKSDFSSAETIHVGVDLQRGLSRDDVIKRLGHDYKLVRVGTIGDTWVVESAKTPTVSYGNIVFDKGVLTSASKNLTPDGEDAFAFTSLFHDTLAQFAKEGKRTCNIETNEFESATATTRSVTLLCGSKSLTMSLTETTTPGLLSKTTHHYADIQERLLSADEHTTH